MDKFLISPDVFCLLHRNGLVKENHLHFSSNWFGVKITKNRRHQLVLPNENSNDLIQILRINDISLMVCFTEKEVMTYSTDVDHTVLPIQFNSLHPKFTNSKCQIFLKSLSLFRYKNMIFGGNYDTKTIILMMIRHFYIGQIFLRWIFNEDYTSELIKQKLIPLRENVTTLLNSFYWIST